MFVNAIKIIIIWQQHHSISIFVGYIKLIIVKLITQLLNAKLVKLVIF